MDEAGLKLQYLENERGICIYNKCHGGNTLIGIDVWTEGLKEKVGNNNHVSMMKFLTSNGYHKSNEQPDPEKTPTT